MNQVIPVNLSGGSRGANGQIWDQDVMKVLLCKLCFALLTCTWILVCPKSTFYAYSGKRIINLATIVRWAVFHGAPELRLGLGQSV